MNRTDANTDRGSAGDIEVRDERMRDIFASVSVTEVRSGFEFLEGPIWRAGKAELVFSDIAGNCMYVLRRDGEIAPYRQPSNMANGNVLDREGRLLTCEHATSRVVREENDGSLTVLADNYEGAELNSPNDIVVAGDGTVLFTDPTYGREEYYGVPRPESQDLRAVYSLNPNTHELRRLCHGFDQPNGLCLSRDEAHLYVNDSERKQIKRFRYAAGAASDGEVIAELNDTEEGGPDGMKFDSDGHLFCTGPGGVHVLTEDGLTLGVIRTPIPVANFNWGDEDLRTLYLCARNSLLRVRTRIPGQPAPE